MKTNYFVYSYVKDIKTKSKWKKYKTLKTLTFIQTHKHTQTNTHDTHVFKGGSLKD